MDKATLDRLRRLAGNEVASELPKDDSGRNMYQIRDRLMEAAKPDFADIDGDGDEKETAKKAAKDKEKMEEAEGRPYVCVHAKKGTYECHANSSYEAAKKAASHWKLKSTAGIDAHLADVKHTPTESKQMREWANSIYKQYDDRGHYQEQPDGETVDLSLRRYLNAKAMPVQLEEDHTEEGMLREYKNFKKGKK